MKIDQDISSLLLGKPLTHLTLQDVEQFFRTQRTESDKLEFKSFVAGGPGGSKTDEEERKILKTICAFLNSDGGVVVWGSPIGTTPAGQKEKVVHGALTPFPTRYEKDAFIAKVASRIIPSPRGVLFHRLEDQGNYIYLFEVPPGEYSPHQFENVYYMRMDGQTQKAPHFYIEALFRKVSFPRLEAGLKLNSLRPDNSDVVSLFCSVIFRNLSRYQNDENLHFWVFSDRGRIKSVDAVVISLIDPAIQSGSDYSPGIIADTIYFGNFLHHSFRIMLSRQNLASAGSEVKLRIQFGARYSPMKLSYYTLKIPLALPAHRQDIIVAKTENMYFHENDVMEEVTDDERFSDTLNN